MRDLEDTNARVQGYLGALRKGDRIAVLEVWVKLVMKIAANRFDAAWSVGRPELFTEQIEPANISYKVSDSDSGKKSRSCKSATSLDVNSDELSYRHALHRRRQPLLHRGSGR